MMKIVDCQCFEFRPKDRDYNAKGADRDPQMEILGDGISYALRTQHIYGLLIWEKDDGDETDLSRKP